MEPVRERQGCPIEEVRLGFLGNKSQKLLDLSLVSVIVSDKVFPTLTASCTQAA
jgi:hypothetical protein